mgnify:CR=1 FL=1
MKAELKELALAATMWTRCGGRDCTCYEVHRDFQNAASPGAILKLIAERDALYKVVQNAVNILNTGCAISSASHIHKYMLAALVTDTKEKPND